MHEMQEPSHETLKGIVFVGAQQIREVRIPLIRTCKTGSEPPGPKKAKSVSLKLVFSGHFLTAFKIRFSGEPQDDPESTSPDQVLRLGFTLGGLGSTLV